MAISTCFTTTGESFYETKDSLQSIRHDGAAFTPLEVEKLGKKTGELSQTCTVIWGICQLVFLCYFWKVKLVSRKNFMIFIFQISKYDIFWAMFELDLFRDINFNNRGILKVNFLQVYKKGTAEEFLGFMTWTKKASKSGCGF